MLRSMRNAEKRWINMATIIGGKKVCPPQALAYYQMHEEVSLVKDFGRFRAALELLVGHGVWTHELLGERLTHEVDAAWQAWQSEHR